MLAAGLPQAALLVAHHGLACKQPSSGWQWLAAARRTAGQGAIKVAQSLAAGEVLVQAAGLGDALHLHTTGQRRAARTAQKTGNGDGGSRGGVGGFGSTGGEGLARSNPGCVSSITLRRCRSRIPSSRAHLGQLAAALGTHHHAAAAGVAAAGLRGAQCHATEGGSNLRGEGTAGLTARIGQFGQTPLQLPPRRLPLAARTCIVLDRSRRRQWRCDWHGCGSNGGSLSLTPQDLHAVQKAVQVGSPPAAPRDGIDVTQPVDWGM